MNIENTWIQIEKVIRIISKSADQGLIPRRSAEIIIQEIYHATNQDRFKTPK